MTGVTRMSEMRKDAQLREPGGLLLKDLLGP